MVFYQEAGFIDLDAAPDGPDPEAVQLPEGLAAVAEGVAAPVSSSSSSSSSDSSSSDSDVLLSHEPLEKAAEQPFVEVDVPAVDAQEPHEGQEQDGALDQQRLRHEESGRWVMVSISPV